MTAPGSALYTLHLAHQELDQIENGEQLWWPLNSERNLSLELREPGEEMWVEDSHKYGYRLSDTDLKRIREGARIGWTTDLDDSIVLAVDTVDEE